MSIKKSLKKSFGVVTTVLLLSSSVWAQGNTSTATPVAATPATQAPDCDALKKELKTAKKDKAKTEEIKQKIKEAGCKVGKASKKN